MINTVQRPAVGERRGISARPRIAYVVADPGIGVFGRKGASVHVQEIVRAWRNRGYDPHLYCIKTGHDRPADLADLEVTVAELSGGGDSADRERELAAAAVHLAERVVNDGCVAVYERFSLFSTALPTITKTLGVPGFLEVNAPLIEEQTTYRTLVDRPAAERALRHQVRAASSIIAVSRPVAAWLRTYGAAGVRVVPNGVNVDRFRPAVARSGVPVAVFVGTLKPWHGVAALVEAAALARGRWTLRIVGDGPDGPALRQLADQLGVDIDFRGAVAPSQVATQLADCAVGVAPYPIRDGHYFSPLKVYEYAAAGLPVVATDVGDLAALVGPDTGRLLSAPNPADLAAAISEVTADATSAARQGATARRLVSEHHSWDSVLDRSVDPYSPRTDAESATEPR